VSGPDYEQRVNDERDRLHLTLVQPVG
jgi:hypothetical protein